MSVNDTDYTEKRCNEALRTQILDFFAISTREQSGAKKLKRFIGNEKNIETVLDPTLLHDQKTYAEITSKRWIYGDYIFIQCLVV